MIFATVSGYLWRGYFGHQWWSLRYAVSLLIPFLVAPIAVWILFVPEHLELSQSALIIKPRFREFRTLPWATFSSWGKGNGVFIINFQGSPSIQIFPKAYPPEQWSQLLDFFVSRFSNRKAHAFIGTFGFRIGR